MNKLLLLAVMHLFALPGFCQSTAESPNLSGHPSGRSFFQINTGLSIPVGTFAHSDMLEKTSGYAKTGAILQVEGGHLIHKHIGAGGNLRMHFNPMDYPVIYLDQSFNVETTPWKITTFLAGLYFNFRFNKSVELKLKAYFGFAGVKSPSIKMWAGSQGARDWVMQHSKKTSSFAFSPSASLNVNLNSRLFFTSDLSCLFSNPEFTGVEVTGSDGKLYHARMQNDIRIISIGAGLGMKF